MAGPFISTFFPLPSSRVDRGGFSSALSSPRKSNAGFLVPKRPSISQSGGKSGHKLSPASGGGGRTPAAAAGASGGGYDILDVKDFDWCVGNTFRISFIGCSFYIE